MKDFTWVLWLSGLFSHWTRRNQMLLYTAPVHTFIHSFIINAPLGLLKFLKFKIKSATGYYSNQWNVYDPLTLALIQNHSWHVMRCSNPNQTHLKQLVRSAYHLHGFENSMLQIHLIWMYVSALRWLGLPWQKLHKSIILRKKNPIPGWYTRALWRITLQVCLFEAEGARGTPMIHSVCADLSLTPLKESWAV